jgi:hypothetical protein
VIACRLPLDDQLKIIDVAYSAGYENPQHFSRAFRRISGLSPRSYRSQLRSAARESLLPCPPHVGPAPDFDCDRHIARWPTTPQGGNRLYVVPLIATARNPA